MKGNERVMNMIDAKYGMKYPFPHTMTHIIDNSGYRGTASINYADDPSLFSTIVVGAFPMGEDRRVIRLTDTRIPRVCYGLNSITQADRDKYGQVVDYPLSLINQGAPVQMLRVTPEDSTYAFVTIFVSYKWDDETDEPVLHVKFESESEAPTGSVLANFKNPERLAQLLINEYAKQEPSSDGWTKRVFAVIVSAGRGRVYNNMRMAINTVSQAKRPTNTRYSFSTIDSRVSAVIEEFVGTLVNIDNPDSTVDTVNSIVNQRSRGGSVLKPIINEKAVTEIFGEYTKHYAEQVETGEYDTNDFIINTQKTLNVNTFDIITGKYIYGGGLDVSLPFYQVDAEDPDIPRLAEAYKLLTTTSQATVDAQNKAPATILQNKMINACYGITNDGSSVYVGDVYLSTTGSRYQNPRLVFICGINQYTQAITAVSFDTVYPLDGTATDTNGVGIGLPPQPIKKVYETAPTNAQRAADGLVSGDIFAIINSSSTSASSFTLHMEGNGGAYSTYRADQIVSAIPFDKKPGMSNIVAVYNGDQTTDEGWKLSKHKTSIGYTVIDITKGDVYVNDYEVATRPAENDRIDINRLLIKNNSVKFGNVPDVAGIATENYGLKYDVLEYADADITKWAICNVPLTNAGSSRGWTIGERCTLTTGNATLQFEVTKINPNDGTALAVKPINNNSSTSPTKITGEQTLVSVSDNQRVLTVTFTEADNYPFAAKSDATPKNITRYVISGVLGSLWKLALDGVVIPDDYYSPTYGINMSSEFGGVALDKGSAGFLDDPDVNEIVFKYKYAELLVRAFRGKIDPSIMSPIRVPAKFMFDAGYNTVIGSSFITSMSHTVEDWINGSVVFNDDEKEEILFNPDLIASLSPADIDVKQALYDLMIIRIYDGIPEDKRPIGPGSGFNVLFDSCTTDGATAAALNKSFATRFTNPNGSWDIGGLTTPTGYTYTFVKRVVDNLVNHCKTYSINKPFTGDYTTIAPTEYSSIFPDIDADNWTYRELMWNSGGNAWLPDSNGYVKRSSQRTFYEDETSDLLWESNMRTLSQLTYLLRQKIEHYLFEYSDDSTLKTMKTECDTMFSNWVGSLVDELNIEFEHGLNTDGGDIVICRVRVVFRGLVIRVPIIVDVQRRVS